MATNPLLDQGVVNRIRGSVVFATSATFNVTASYLSKAGIRLSLDGKTITYIDTLVGQARSPEPYVPVTCQIHLLKTQTLSNQYKLQMELNSFLGDYTVRPDTKQLSPYGIVNGGIMSVDAIDINGQVAEWVVSLGGYYPVNSQLWDQST